jgi:anti-sigma-K factor RskA
MSGKGSFTSRERIAMIVVAGVVAIAIAAIALQRRNETPVVIEKTAVAQTQRRAVKDSVATKKTAKKSARKSRKKREAKPESQPKPRDYFTSPENE